MKRILALLAALLLMAAPALGETFTAPGAFTLEYGREWEADVSDLAEYSEPENGYYYLGTLYGHETVIEMAITDYRDTYDDFSLYGGGSANIAVYREAIEAMYQEMGCNASYVQIFKENPETIPFIIYFEDCEHGESYYVDTMSGGWCITFYCYTYYEEDALTEAHLSRLLKLLSTFRPIR